MAEPSIEHDTIVVERRYAAAPTRVYAAWVEPTGRDRWDVPGDGWDHVTDERDSRPLPIRGFACAGARSVS